MKPITKDAFVQILRTFADDPEDVRENEGRIECRIYDEDLLLALSENEEGVLFCEEPENPDSHRMKAGAWIEKKLARLPDLAQRILQAIPEDERYVSVSSEFDSSFGGGAKETVERTADSLFERLKTGGSQSTEVYYLLSNAGEGKTSIMLRLARLVAEAYRAGDVHFLFLPVGLDGRPFLRFDEVVIGALTQKYRFRRFYYESLVELAKNGFLVLGLDGFEEMTVEGKENAVVSSLGDLIRQHDSGGCLVVSARKAFYDYALKNQAPMIDAIRNLNVDFHTYRLRPWGETEFLALMEKFGFSDGEANRLYGWLAAKFGNRNHPILTQPVLARKLVELMADERNGADDRERIVDGLSPDENAQAILRQFVELMLRREASEKWIRHDGAGSGAFQQLLSWSEHALLLEEIAEEMWLSSVECLGLDVLQSLVQLFCENRGKTPAETNACSEKIASHAMLSRTETGENFFFYHDAFRQFFLGSRIAHALLRKEAVRNELLSHDILSEKTIDAAVLVLADSNRTFAELKDDVDSVRRGQTRNTPVNQNAAAILAGLWKRFEPGKVRFENLFFAASATESVPFRNVVFRQCAFENVSVPAGAAFDEVRFLECKLYGFSVKANEKVRAVFDEGSLPDKLVFRRKNSNENEEIYDPREILSLMAKRGCSVPLWKEKEQLPERRDPHDAKLFHAFGTLLRLFMRTTGVRGSVLRSRMNKQWGEWEDAFIPEFIKQGLLSKETWHGARTTWHGGGSDDRYVLKVPAGRYEKAMMNCRGKFDEFCRLMKQAH